MARKFTVKTEHVHHLYEHELLICFVNDEDAVLFRDWMEHDGGMKLFEQYCKDARPD